jgi:small subunit ribosomal protein S8
MVGDPIADFINRIATASSANKESITVPFSKMKLAVGKLLEKEGFVGKVEKRGKKVRKHLDVDLLYVDGSPRVKKARRISKPGRRVYYKVSDIRLVRSGKGLLAISTPEGVLSGSDARSKKLGGEALFTIE